MKGERQTEREPSLFDRIQEISLDQLEIGRLIGKGCNAAVHEARLKAPIHGTFILGPLGNFSCFFVIC